VINKGALAAIAVLAVVVFGTPTQAETDRHFRARIDLTQTGPPVPDARCSAGTVLVSFTGSGNMTRGGRVSAEASHCIVDDPAVEPFTDGEMTLSSRRGDLFIEYEGNDAAGDLSGTFVITGGTGDFAGATGGGTLSGTADPAGIGRGILEGTISVP
jgi:hypothetical protein